MFLNWLSLEDEKLGCSNFFFKILFFQNVSSEILYYLKFFPIELT